MTKDQPAETLASTIERVTYHNAETGFAVLKVQARGQRDLVTMIGHTPAVSAGEWITASGGWIHAVQHDLARGGHVPSADEAATFGSSHRPV